MKIRFARVLLTVFAVALSSMLVSAPVGVAKTKTKRLSVRVTTITAADCTVAPDQVRIVFGFEAKVKRKNVKAPSRITVSYKITDPATGVVRVSERVTLKPPDYLNFGTPAGYTVGSVVQFDGSFTYKSTINGKRITATNSHTITMPTNDELAAGGVKPCV